MTTAVFDASCIYRFYALVCDRDSLHNALSVKRKKSRDLAILGNCVIFIGDIVPVRQITAGHATGHAGALRHFLSPRAIIYITDLPRPRDRIKAPKRAGRQKTTQ